ncbi:MAG: succinic semialdehyde dehydrogenase [Corynebacterium kroppenstedtii]|nr:succinic semialdehyde dehydrogenase [Corynebacterium kroppenstedtii]
MFAPKCSTFLPDRLLEGPLPDDLAAELRALTVNTATGSVDTEKRHNVENPWDGTIVGWVGIGTTDDVAHAFRRAREVQKTWRETPFDQRKRILTRFHDLVLKKRDLLLDIIQLETGKDRASAFDEVMDVANNARYYANAAEKLMRPARRTAGIPVLGKAREYRSPKGVVGQITPWNYPLTLGISDALAAIAAGNTVVAKPDSDTPFCSLICVQLLKDAGLPDDVIQIVTGQGRVVGSAIADACDYLMFTGSTKTGQRLGEQVGRRLVGFSAELGGKNPMIITGDADARRAASCAVNACFSNSGQLCVSIERIYVVQDMYDDFVSAFIAEVNRMKLSAGFDWSVTMGSLVSKEQLATVESFVDDAREKGARILAGGRARPDLGPCFYEPTVVEGVSDDMRLKRDEVFGPVVYVEKVNTVDDALARANDTNYGLNASVVGPSDTAWNIARRVEAGTVNINDGYAAAWSTVDAPLGGVKDSGMSRRHGAEGLLKYTESHTIVEMQGMPVSGPRFLSRKLYAAIMGRLLGVGQKLRLLK